VKGEGRGWQKKRKDKKRGGKRKKRKGIPKELVYNSCSIS